MDKKFISDTMKQVLEKSSGSKSASLHYFRPQDEKKPRQKRKRSRRAAARNVPRGELLLDRDPAGFDLALLKQQMDLLQEGILSIHEKLSGIEASRVALQNENATLRENNLELTQRLSRDEEPGNGREPYEPHELQTGTTVYRHKTSGEHVCPKCFEYDRTAIRIQSYRVRISTVSRCPRCHDQFHTEESEREPVKILPPEDAAPAEAAPQTPA